MRAMGQPAADQGTALLAMYDRALPQVFGYLRPRVGSETTAEDLTAETFLAAVQAIERRAVPDLTVAWLIGVARHKLVDHWRREAREARHLRSLPDESVVEDGVDERFERARAHEVLEELGAHHRAALTLRYHESGGNAECVDDQGLRFDLFRPRPGYEFRLAELA